MQHAAGQRRRTPGPGGAPGWGGASGAAHGRELGGGPGPALRRAGSGDTAVCAGEGLLAGLRGELGFGGCSVHRAGSSEVCDGEIAIKSDRSKSLEVGVAARLTGEMAQSEKMCGVRVENGSGSSAPGSGGTCCAARMA